MHPKRRQNQLHGVSNFNLSLVRLSNRAGIFCAHSGPRGNAQQTNKNNTFYKNNTTNKQFFTIFVVCIEIIFIFAPTN